MVKIADTFECELNWLLTGQEPVQKRQCPQHGYDLIRLPRGDPERLSPAEAERLERALYVLRAKGKSEHYAESLTNNIDSFHEAVLLTQGVEASSEPGQGKKNAG